MDNQLKINWVKTWIINLIDVYLFAAALNCLFQWLANGTKHDLIGCIISVTCGAIIYIISKKSKNQNKCIAIAISVLLTWIIAFSILINITNNNNNSSAIKSVSQTSSEKQ